MKHCSKCNSLMPEDVTRCIRCGYESAAAAAPASATANSARPAPPASPAKRGRIRNGWSLAKLSSRILWRDKALLVFPLMSGIACTLLLASFLAAAWASGVGSAKDTETESAAWGLVFAYYAVNYFVIVFFNSALVACVLIRFRGGSPTVRDGLRAAGERVAQIAAWALLAATVGVTLRIIEERVQFVGKIVVAVLGAGWTLGAYFVVPILVVEKAGPIDAFKRSVAILRKAWGESIVSNVGIGLIMTLVTVPLIILVGTAALVLALGMNSLAVALAGLVLVVALMVLATLIGSALSTVTLGALYVYASGDRVPEAFRGSGIESSFVAR